VAGTPEDVARSKNSRTAPFLRRLLEGPEQSRRAKVRKGSAMA
jgi:hypothetical protein